jgi:hypothetical protein
MRFLKLDCSTAKNLLYLLGLYAFHSGGSFPLKRNIMRRYSYSVYSCPPPPRTHLGDYLGDLLKELPVKAQQQDLLNK